jgi:hypothetical protein
MYVALNGGFSSFASQAKIALADSEMASEDSFVIAASSRASPTLTIEFLGSTERRKSIASARELLNNHYHSWIDIIDI